ncbi:hypothetical protein GON03_01880 [Nocardioides sp. MAH-18]|uniref:Secreted protein n=1 Tax=Nocardioides agri TaxID=2682843 RepID=A0A6L6XL54_9ACTN|nr:MULTISPECIES: DUF6167 family protein [unclassified Nocardioides]MBA2953044.1 hypothetical protein [Nocardioides sp. CGMCC 1.13656]MVQ47914.1 hypothetical protein [Nocardioides sp. MAH-18]
MRRGLWFVAGAGTAVYVMVRGRRAAEVLTVDGLKDRVGALELGARLVRDEVAQGRAEKESELREKLGLVPHGAPELTGGRHKAITTDQTPDHTPDHTKQEGSN